MHIRRLSIKRYRGIRELTLFPTSRTVILGPNNASKTTVLEALDLLLHPGIGRPRPAPTEVDYFGRDPSQEFSIEAVMGRIPEALLPEVRQHLEGWRAADQELVPDPEAEGVEPVFRVRVRGTTEFEVMHDFAKDETAGTRFSPRIRAAIGWVYDGRTRDPSRQLAFYQGGLLDRLFGDVDLNPAVTALKQALGAGAGSVNAETNVKGKLQGLGDDLRTLGLVRPQELPQFEVGAVTTRELLQALQLALPAMDVQIPLFRQGRGVQRLLLVAVLLRLAQAAGHPSIGGFEEPEEALEPLRQAQVAHMLCQLVDAGGQIFVVTHSPEIARAFWIDDFVLLRERSGGEGALALRTCLSEPVRQKYERCLDRAVVRALFARIPMLVEGPGDRAVAEVFWWALTKPTDGTPPVRQAEQLGLDVINCEGSGEMPMMARLLKEAGKTVVAWAEQDVPPVLSRLRSEGHCAAILLHDPAPDHHNLEHALAQSASLPALIKALDALATSRGYSWDEQRMPLISSELVPSERRAATEAAKSLPDLFATLDESTARALICRALSATTVTPFEMKGARQGRIVAETILEVDGTVPAPFRRAFRALDSWIAAGCKGGTEIPMAE